MPKTIKIGACQTPEYIGDIPAALKCIEGFARQATSAGVSLLLFPECFLQGYIVTPGHLGRYAYDLSSPEFQQILAQLAFIKPVLVFGVIERKGERYFNSAVVVEQGKLIGVYRKTHLVPGESAFTPGSDYPIFELKGLKYSINICYDAQFPEAAAAVASQGAQLLLLPAQNMMRRESAEKWKHEHNRLRIQRVRETGLWLVSSDVTGGRGADRIAYGPTCAINPAGEIVAAVPLLQPGLMTVEISSQPLANHPQ